MYILYKERFIFDVPKFKIMQLSPVDVLKPITSDNANLNLLDPARPDTSNSELKLLPYTSQITVTLSHVTTYFILPQFPLLPQLQPLHAATHWLPKTWTICCFKNDTYCLFINLKQLGFEVAHLSV